MCIRDSSNTTSVAVISLKNSSLQRGQDFINQLLEMYNRNTNNDKNEMCIRDRSYIENYIKEHSLSDCIELKGVSKSCLLYTSRCV